MGDPKLFLLILFFGTVCGRYLQFDDPLSFDVEDLHLDDVTDVTMLYDTKFLVKRATDAIMLRENDAKDTSYGYSVKTEDFEHTQKGMVVKGELSVVGAYTIHHPDGIVQTTMYVADKNGYRPQVKLRLSLLKSAVG